MTDLGVVVQTAEEPKRFVPIPPAKAFKNYLKEYERKTKSLFSAVSSLEETFNEARKDDNPEGEMIWTIRGRTKILKRIERMLAKAKNNVEIITDGAGSVLLYKKFDKLFDKMKHKSIEVRFFAPSRSLNSYVFEQLRYMCNVANTNVSLPLIFLNVDEKHFLMAKMQFDDNSSNLRNEIAVFSDSQSLAKIIHILLREIACNAR